MRNRLAFSRVKKLMTIKMTYQLKKSVKDGKKITLPFLCEKKTGTPLDAVDEGNEEEVDDAGEGDTGDTEEKDKNNVVEVEDEYSDADTSEQVEVDYEIHNMFGDHDHDYFNSSPFN